MRESCLNAVESPIYLKGFTGMLLSPKAIPQGHSETTFALADSPDRPGWPRIDGSLRCECSVDRTAVEIMAIVRFEGAVVLECARCLKEYAEPVAGEVAVVLVDAQSVARYAPGGEDGDGVYTFDESTESVDISDALYDEIMLSVPMKPLCDESCGGGPVEGQTLVQEDKDILMDSRWSVLADLKKKLYDK